MLPDATLLPIRPLRLLAVLAAALITVPACGSSAAPANAADTPPATSNTASEVREPDAPATAPEAHGDGDTDPAGPVPAGPAPTAGIDGGDDSDNPVLVAGPSGEDGDGAGNAPVDDFDVDAAYQQLVAHYADIPNPTETAERAAVTRDLIYGFDELAGSVHWDAVGDLLAQQREAKGGQPLFELIDAFWRIRDAGPESEAAGASWARIRSLAGTVTDYAWPHQLLGAGALRQGNTDEALTHTRRALAIRARFIDARRVLIGAMITRGEDAGAIADAIETSIAMRPADLTPELQFLAAIEHDDRIAELLDSGLPPVASAQARYWLGMAMPIDRAEAVREHWRAGIAAVDAPGDTLRERRLRKETGDTLRHQLAGHLITVDPLDPAAGIQILETVLDRSPDHLQALTLYSSIAKLQRSGLMAFRSLNLLLDIQAATAHAFGLHAEIGQLVTVMEIDPHADRPIPRQRIWRLLARDIAADPEPSDDAISASIALVDHLCPREDRESLGMPGPVYDGRFGGLAAGDVEIVVDFLVKQTSHRSFRIRLPAFDLSALIVRGTGVRRTQFVALASEALGSDPAAVADSMGLWGRSLALLGDTAHAPVLVAAMHRCLATDDRQLCRRLFDPLHRALRYLIDEDLDDRWSSRRASITEMESLAQRWADRIGG